jgi:hypothetical protein
VHGATSAARGGAEAAHGRTSRSRRPWSGWETGIVRPPRTAGSRCSRTIGRIRTRGLTESALSGAVRTPSSPLTQRGLDRAPRCGLGGTTSFYSNPAGPPAPCRSRRLRNPHVGCDSHRRQPTSSRPRGPRDYDHQNRALIEPDTHQARSAAEGIARAAARGSRWAGPDAPGCGG